ncbi:MAG: ABC transporter ATP-binding protein [Deltaproteobacteria bacterium]|nr:ABC transporter ATP-binding protein [Deltaproteobacteria bacterium]
MTTNDYSLEIDSISKLYRVFKPQGHFLAQFALNAVKRLRGHAPAQRRPVREILALDNISFKVRTGESLGIIGPNGAGKSTLLKILSRVTFPTRGVVRGKGRLVPLLEAGAAFNKDLTARENIYLSGALFGISVSAIHCRMDSILEWAELERFADLPLGKFSSGMAIRLSFSIAVNLEPNIILADEILAVGDLRFRNRCEERIAEISKQGTTLLFVSHDMQAIRNITQRALFIVQGRLIDEGYPEEMIIAYEQYAAQQSRVRRLSRDEVMSRNEYTVILDPEITSSMREIKGIVSLNEDFWLKIPFQVNCAGLKYAVNADVYHRGIVVFGSRPEPFTPERSGLYFCWVKIPARLLVDDVYTANVSVFCFDDGHWHVAKLGNAISIPVSDPEDRFQKIREQGLSAPKHWVADPRFEVEYEFSGETNGPSETLQ